MFRLRHAGFTTAAAFVLTAVVACGSGSTGGGLAAESPLPTEIPAGTKIVIADQSERQQVALAASGNLDSLPFDYEFATFQGAPSILEAFRADAVDVAWAGEIMAIQSLVAGDDVRVIAAIQTTTASTWVSRRVPTSRHWQTWPASGSVTPRAPPSRPSSCAHSTRPDSTSTT